jgi:hypothetical protein
VCSEIEYASVFDRLNKTLPPRVEHLIIQLGDSSSSGAHQTGLNI